jgi:DNA-binding protein
LHPPKQGGGNKHVELKAMGKAINKAVTIAEILKRKMPLHQITTLSSCEIVNVYEPLEEGLDTVVNQHYVSCLTIFLSTDPSGMDVHNIGYQVRQDSSDTFDDALIANSFQHRANNFSHHSHQVKCNPEISMPALERCSPRHRQNPFLRRHTCNIDAIVFVNSVISQGIGQFMMLMMSSLETRRDINFYTRPHASSPVQ